MDKGSRYKQIIESSKDRIFRICCGYVRDEHERQDVFQEVLINIWKSLDAFRDMSQVSTWIHRIAVNTCLTHFRIEQRRRQHIDPEASKSIDLIAQEEDAGQTEEKYRSVDELYRCINMLAPIDRAIVALYLEDVCTKEIAETLGITDVNVRVKMHRIRKVLKDLLEEKPYGT